VTILLVTLAGLVLVLAGFSAYLVRTCLVRGQRAAELQAQLQVAVLTQDEATQQQRAQETEARALGERVTELQCLLEEATAAPASDTLDPELAQQLLAEVDEPQPFPGVAGGKTTVFAQQACSHCGGLHSKVCPRIRRISYHETGKVAEVVFWRAGQWPTDEVIWLEDVHEAAASLEPSE
jgi:type II secretory pathway pseudopilin PulG